MNPAVPTRATAPVAVIIVAYRSRATIDAPLDALLDAHRQGLVECTVVDNDGADGTCERVGRAHPWVRVVQSGSNLGFGRANNLGLAGTESSYVLFLNPDAVITADAIRSMVGFLDAHAEVGIVGPAIRTGGVPAQVAGTFPTPRSVIREALGMHPRAYFIGLGSRPFPADWVCGAVMLARRALLERLGGFDPRFFLYFEETDLCRRARALGYRTWAFGEAVADHQPGSSTAQEPAARYHGCIAEHYFRSRFYYLRKHHGWFAAAAAELAELLLFSLRAARAWWRGDPAAVPLLARLRAPWFSEPTPRPSLPAPDRRAPVGSARAGAL